MARVVVFRGRRKEGSYELDRREMVIGRGEGADIRVDNALVSRTHATISFEEGAWRVKDLHSPNGLYVNGERVEGRALQVGDRIELGQHVLVFAGADRADWEQDTVGDKRITDLGGDEPTTILPPKEISSIRRRVSKRMKAHLLIGGGRDRTEVHLETSPIVLGFTDECDVRLPGRALFGKKAAELIRKRGSWSVVALASGAVRLDGDKVSAHALSDGDVLSIKGVEVTFRSDVVE
jgi:hypothetical protein